MRFLKYKKQLGSIVALFLMTSASSLFGQNFDNYVPMKCAGTLPKAVYTSSSETYKKEVAQIETSSKKAKVKKQEKRFSLRNAYAIDQIK
jgi:hypothetical protein